MKHTTLMGKVEWGRLKAIEMQTMVKSLSLTGLSRIWDEKNGVIYYIKGVRSLEVSNLWLDTITAFATRTSRRFINIYHNILMTCSLNLVLGATFGQTKIQLLKEWHFSFTKYDTIME